MAYAPRTLVSTGKTRAEIECILVKAGARRVAFMVEEEAAQVMFDMADRRIRFAMPLPKGNDQARRSKWRAMMQCIKFKLESVASKIETFEEAFLAHVVVPEDNRTVYEHVAPRLAQIAKGGPAVPLLPPPQAER